MPTAVGLPLSALPPPEVLDRLDDRFRALRSARRDARGRHGTLDATVDWSIQLLAPMNRTVLELLGLFAPAFRPRRRLEHGELHKSAGRHAPPGDRPG